MYSFMSRSVILFSNEGGEPLVDRSGSGSNFPWCGKKLMEGRKHAHSLYPLIAGPFLLLVMAVALGYQCIEVCRKSWAQKGWEPAYQTMHLPIVSPEEACATMSKWEPSSQLADLYLSWSSITGCRQGSVPSLWHTLLKRSSVTSLVSLCHINSHDLQSPDSEAQFWQCQSAQLVVNAVWQFQDTCFYLHWKKWIQVGSFLQEVLDGHKDNRLKST